MPRSNANQDEYFFNVCFQNLHNPANFSYMQRSGKFANDAVAKTYILAQAKSPNSRVHEIRVRVTDVNKSVRKYKITFSK